MRYTNRLKQTLLLCGLAVAPMCLAGEGAINCSAPNLPKIDVQFIYSTDDGNTFQELKEGTELRAQKDQYRIVFTPREDYRVTVLQKNSKGDISPLTGADRKPVEAGKKYTLPKTPRPCGTKTANSYCLFGTPGEETLYFIVCPYDGAKAEQTETAPTKIDCNGSPCVKSVTFKHVVK